MLARLTPTGDTRGTFSRALHFYAAQITPMGEFTLRNPGKSMYPRSMMAEQ